MRIDAVENAVALDGVEATVEGFFQLKVSRIETEAGLRVEFGRAEDLRAQPELEKARVAEEVETAHQRGDAGLGDAGGKLVDDVGVGDGADGLPALGLGEAFLSRALEHGDAHAGGVELDAGAGEPERGRSIDRLGEGDALAPFRRVEQPDGGDVDLAGSEVVNDGFEAYHLQLAAQLELGAERFGDGNGETGQRALVVTVGQRRGIVEDADLDRLC